MIGYVQRVELEIICLGSMERVGNEERHTAISVKMETDTRAPMR